MYRVQPTSHYFSLSIWHFPVDSFKSRSITTARARHWEHWIVLLQSDTNTEMFRWRFLDCSGLQHPPKNTDMGLDCTENNTCHNTNEWANVQHSTQSSVWFITVKWKCQQLYQAVFFLLIVRALQSKLPLRLIVSLSSAAAQRWRWPHAPLPGSSAGEPLHSPIPARYNGS